MRKTAIYIGLFLIVACLFSCRKEYAQLKSSTRRVASEFRYLDRSSTEVLNSLGLDNEEKIDSINSQFTPLKQKTFIENFNFLYESINGKNNLTYLKSFQYDSLKNVYRTSMLNRRSLRDSAEVYLWYNTWMGDLWKGYNFDLISTISFLSYNIDWKSGAYLNDEEISIWKNTALIDSAKQHKTKVLLNVSVEGKEQVSGFLANKVAWNTAFDSIATLLEVRGGDGVEFDFSEFSENDQSQLLSFFQFFRKNLDYKFLSRDMIISIVLPTIPTDFPISIPILSEEVDLFIVNGKDYHELDPSLPAVSPLRSIEPGGISLENTVKGYLDKGLNPKISILALPLYGAQWKGSWNEEEETYTSEFERKIIRSEIDQVFQSIDSSYSLIPTLDEVSLTNYYFLEFKDGTSIDCWYDDGFTLGKKIDLALFNGFKGVGLWALGYDLGIDETWGLISDKFSESYVEIKDPIAEINGYPIKIAHFFHDYERLFVITFSICTIFLVFTLALAFSDWRFREAILAKQLYRFIVLSVSVAIVFPLFWYFDIISNEMISYLLIFLLGALISYLIEKYSGLLKINKP